MNSFDERSWPSIKVAINHAVATPRRSTRLSGDEIICGRSRSQLLP